MCMCACACVHVRILTFVLWLKTGIEKKGKKKDALTLPSRTVICEVPYKLYFRKSPKI